VAGVGRGIGRAGLVQIVIEPPPTWIEERLLAIGAGFTFLEGLWHRISEVMAQIESELFASGGWGKWPPLAASTLEQKAKLGYPPDPLVREGDLKDSLENAGQAAVYSPKRLVYGTDVPYAIYHQVEHTPGRPPTRKVIDLEGQEYRITRAAEEYALELSRLL